jgi:hypothetical protein
MVRMQDELSEIIGRHVDPRTKGSSAATSEKKWSPKPRWSLSRSDDWVRLRQVRIWLPQLAEEFQRIPNEDGA